MSNITSSCDKRQAQPAGSVCNTTNCLIDFDGYYWWTNYPFNISGSGYWFNNQQWDPRLAFADKDGLHLQMQVTTMPGAPQAQWSSVELLLWGKSGQPNGNPAPERFYPGYGTYLVAATTAGGFNSLANNCCFGAFTYRFNKDDSQINKYHELDMIEISRFGKPNDPTNAQFTLQPWDNPGNVHRITLKDKGEVTIVMNWPGAGVPVTYGLYYGIFDLDNLPSKPDIAWTTSAAQNVYIPDNACQTVHLNLWREPQHVMPSGNQEVTVKKFQFWAK